MAMTGFICHDNYYDRLKRLTNEEVGNLFRQLMLYHAGRYDEMSDFVGSEGIAFDFISDDIARMEEKQKETSETNRINGSKGGRPKKQTEPEETEENRNKPTEIEENQTKPYKDKEKDKDIYINNKEKEKEREREPQKRFTPPTIEEVAEYCLERGNGINAQHFIDYYQQGGWVLKNGKKMQDWKAAVRTWEGNSYGNRSSPKVVSAQQYQQRDYSDEQAEAMRRMIEGANANAG